MWSWPVQSRAFAWGAVTHLYLLEFLETSGKDVGRQYWRTSQVCPSHGEAEPINRAPHIAPYSGFLQNVTRHFLFCISGAMRHLDEPTQDTQSGATSGRGGSPETYHSTTSNVYQGFGSDTCRLPKFHVFFWRWKAILKIQLGRSVDSPLDIPRFFCQFEQDLVEDSSRIYIKLRA